MENTNHSVVFKTANGHKVEVTQAQMDRVRSQLWHDVQPTQSGQKIMAVNKSENKENEIDYFGDTSDFEFDSDFEENILNDVKSKGRVLEDITSSVNPNKKRKSF